MTPEQGECILDISDALLTRPRAQQLLIGLEPAQAPGIALAVGVAELPEDDMAENSRIKFLSTVKKDEAAFYLNELARGLLRDRVSIRVGERSLLLDTFEGIHLEMQAHEKKERYGIAIRLTWRKPASTLVIGGADGDDPCEAREETP